MDEGYLQSMAERILDGEKPYVDFYFLRTPLSLYIQAFLMSIFKDGYTLLGARIFLVIQSSLMVILTSFLYKRFCRGIELLLLLFLSYNVMTMLLDFPWYSYDGLFFAILSVLFFDIKKYYVAGLFGFLAGMAKQNYFLLIPLILLIIIIIKLLRKDIVLPGFWEMLKVMAGLFIPVVLFAGYLFFTDSLMAFYNNVLVLPRVCSGYSLYFSIFQDNVIALKAAFPMIVAVVLLNNSNSKKWLLYAIVLILFGIYGLAVIDNTRNFIFFIIFLTYAAATLYYSNSAANKYYANCTSFTAFTPLIIYAIVIQYLAGFNYGGLFFANVGAGFALPVSYLIFRNVTILKFGRTTVYVIFLIITLLSIYHKHQFVYKDRGPKYLSSHFNCKKLGGIKSTEGNVQYVDSMVQFIESHSIKGENIFVYPDFPGVYFLTNRRNPSPIGWYYKREINDAMVAMSVEIMSQNKPELILTFSEVIPEPIEKFISDYYEEISFDQMARAYIKKE